MSEPALTAFTPFHRRLIDAQPGLPALRDAITAVAADGHADALITQVEDDLARRSEQQSFRVLIQAFHRFRDARGLPADPERDDALAAFSAHLASDAACDELLDAHPVLRERLDDVLRLGVDAWTAVMRDLAADLPLLRARGLVADGTGSGSGSGSGSALVEVTATGGDPHQGGRQVVGLVLGDGTRLMAKPRPLGCDDLVRAVLAAAGPHLAHTLEACLPPSVTVGDHGWQAFVQPRPLDDAAQAARYFYRFGALAALMGTIGASDLHGENVLAHGEHPCLIDTETVLRPNAGVVDDTLPHRLVNQLKLSVGPTMLVPMANPNSAMDLDMSGMGVDGLQTSKMRRPVVHDGGTDAVGVQWESVTYRHTDNLPRLDGESLSPVAHACDLLAGYRDGHAAVRAGALDGVLERFADVTVRCLIRSTMVYTRFLDAATHPDYLRDAGEAARLRGLLSHYPDYLSGESAAFVAREERRQLALGDVPYFTAPAGSTALTCDGVASDGVHRESPLAFARRGVAANARRPQAFHDFVLEECLAERVAAGDGSLTGVSVFRPLVDGAVAGTWWRDVVAMLGTLAVRHPGRRGEELGWLGGIGPGRDAPTLTPGNFIAFHDMGGIVAALRHAAEHSADLAELSAAADLAELSAAADLAELSAAADLAGLSAAADRGLDALLDGYRELLARAPEGAFTGAASALLTRPGTVDAAWLHQVVTTALTRGADGTGETDLSNGPAGTAMLLLGAPRAAALVPEGLRARLYDLALAQVGVPRDRLWSDVAHGDLGMRWAQARIGRAVGDDRALADAAAWVRERLVSGAPVTGRGWCNGAAGALLAATEVLVAAGGPTDADGARLDHLLRTAVAAPPPGPVDLSVCHGSSGVVQSLLAVAGLTGRRDLVTRALDVAEQTIHHAREHGWHTGAPGRTTLLGYLLGWSGVADTDLLLARSLAGGVPASACLPVAFRPEGAPGANPAYARPVRDPARLVAPRVHHMIGAQP